MSLKARLARRRLVQAKKRGELPRPLVKAIVVLKDGEIIHQTDSAGAAEHFCYGYGGGEIRYLFKDGTTAPCESAMLKSHAATETADAA